MMDSDKLGERIRELRLAKAKKLGRRRIPQREVAAELNISHGAYGSWESGRTSPDIEMLPKIADYFEVSIDSLLGHTTGIQASPEHITAEKGLVWSLRRWAQTENEEKGIEVWQRLARGEDLETIATALKIPSLPDIECWVKDVIYTDVIDIEHHPRDVPLAQRVQRAFGLREVVVVPVMAGAPLLLRNILLGEAARDYFRTHVVHEGMKVGIAGGYSVSRMIYSLRRGECRSVEIYPLAISPVIEAVSLDANSLAGTFAYRHDGYDVRGYALQYASPLDWKKAKDVRQFAPTLRILAKARSVDIAFMGIGIVGGHRRAAIDLLGEVLATRGLDFEMMRERGAVGDVLYHLVDRSGNQVAPEIDELICSIELENLQRMVQWGVPVVVIASGERKAEIARAAIKGGYVNVFIVDDELARAMLESEIG
jgi:DNA-binding transcriptional regulator LsrR (DeoR family)/DNA-binding XRE family transcriptional regulator